MFVNPKQKGSNVLPSHLGEKCRQEGMREPVWNYIGKIGCISAESG